jgi:hypothetical protein
MWFLAVTVDEGVFKVRHEKVCKRWGYLCAHGCASDLEVMFAIEVKIVFC